MVVCFFHNRLYNKDPGIWFSVNTHTGHIDPLPPNDLSLFLYFPLNYLVFLFFFHPISLNFPCPMGMCWGKWLWNVVLQPLTMVLKMELQSYWKIFFFVKKQKLLLLTLVIGKTRMWPSEGGTIILSWKIQNLRL